VRIRVSYKKYYTILINLKSKKDNYFLELVLPVGPWGPLRKCPKAWVCIKIPKRFNLKNDQKKYKPTPERGVPRVGVT